MKYKKLIVSGCSYTENQGSWAYNLSIDYNLELVNLAVSGAGNNHIVWSLLSYLERNQIDPETTLIGIMWSHPIRDDYIFDHNYDFEDQSIYKYKYDSDNRLVMRGDLLYKDVRNKMNIPYSTIEYKKSLVAGRENRSAITFKTWSLKNLLTSYLISKKINFFQTAFLNYLNHSALIIANTDSDFQKTFSYLSELKRINLNSALTNWVDLSDTEYLGDFAFYKNMLESDKYHPNKLAHALWTKQILIPKLKNTNMI
jgi:hypothetical protein